MTDVDGRNYTPADPITPEEATRQLKAAKDLLMKHLQPLCDLMRDLRQNTWRRSEKVNHPYQGSWKPFSSRSDMVTGPVNKRTDDVSKSTKPTTPTTRSP